MADDLLEQAATATQGMIPGVGGGGQQQPMTTFGPTPIVQPPPIPRYQAPLSQGDRQTHFETVGSRKRADKQALFSGIANFVKSGADYIQANKQRNLSMDLERLMEAQQGMNEAQQTLQQNPNDPKAKAALETNISIINTLTKDPKKAKLFQKALNIDLFGDGKNKKENQALVEAWKQFQQKQQAGDKTALNPIASRIMQQQPQREQLSPEAQAQAQAVKAGLLPKAGEILKAQSEVYKSIQSAKTSEERTAAISKAAELRAAAEKEHAGALVDAANIRAVGMEKAAEIRSRAQVYIAKQVGATWDKRIAEMDKIAGLKDQTENNKTLFGSLSKEAGQYNTALKNLNDENIKLQAELDKKGTSIMGIKVSAASGADAKMMRIKIGANNAAIKAYQQQLETVNKKLQTLQGMNMIDMNALAGSDSEVNVNDDEVPEE